MKKVKVTITTDKPVSVKITPCNDALDELLEALDGEKKEEGNRDVVSKKKTRTIIKG